MNWLKLVGLRFLDFIITSIVIVLIFVGLMEGFYYVDEHYGLDSTREKVVMRLADETIKKIIKKGTVERREALHVYGYGYDMQENPRYQEFLKRLQVQEEALQAQEEAVDMYDAFIQHHRLLSVFGRYSYGQLREALVRYKCDRLKRQLDNAILLDRIVVWRILPIALFGVFGVISILGISLRPKGFTQRESFVWIWVSVPKVILKVIPKILTQYFAGYIKKSGGIK